MDIETKRYILLASSSEKISKALRQRDEEVRRRDADTALKQELWRQKPLGSHPSL